MYVYIYIYIYIYIYDVNLSHEHTKISSARDSIINLYLTRRRASFLRLLLCSLLTFFTFNFYSFPVKHVFNVAH